MCCTFTEEKAGAAMKKKIILLLTVCICLTACSSKEKKVPLEDIGMVGVMAIDYIDEDLFRLTMTIPQFSEDAKENNESFTVETDLLSKGIIEIESLSDKKVVLNQLQVILINEEFARLGQTEEIIRFLYRNSEIGNKVLIAVVKESGEKILSAKYPDKPNINFYLNDLLGPSINTAFNPNTNIHDFMYTQTNPVFDSILPYLTKKEDEIELSGIALYKAKSMIKVLTPQEGLIIQSLQNRKNLMPLYLTLNENNGEEKLLLDLLNSRVNMKSNKDLSSPKLTIHLKLEGTLVEYKGVKEGQLNTNKDISKLQNEINQKLESDILNFMEELKELQVDPVGLTENFRMYYNGDWSHKKTIDVISKLELDITVETIIFSTGTLK